jgi:aldehyde:ferredoxin oxidoreductase
MVLPRLREILGAEATDILMDWRVSARSIKGKGIALALNQDQNAFVNSLELCGSAGGEGGFTLDELAELVSAATGVEMNGDGLMKIGERIYNLEKAFNIREGMGRKDDTLPQRFFTEEDDPRGHSGMNETKFQEMLDDYYQFRGWDREGIPTIQKLEELGLSDIAEQIGAARG